MTDYTPLAIGAFVTHSITRYSRGAVDVVTVNARIISPLNDTGMYRVERTGASVLDFGSFGWVSANDPSLGVAG